MKRGECNGAATFSEKGVPTYMDRWFLGVRTKNWLAIGGLYALFYMTRYNFTANMGALSGHFGWDKGQLGYFETMMPFVYGIAVILNSWVTDRIGGKRAFSFGAIGVIVMNVLSGLGTMLVSQTAVMAGTGKDEHVVTPAIMHFGLSNSFVLMLMVVIWGANGFFQSFGAIAIVKINAAWFHKNERGKFSGIFGILIRAGLVLGFSVTPLIASALPIGFVYIAPAGLVALMLMVHRRYVNDTPEKAGVIGFTTGDKDDGKGEAPLAFSETLYKIYANWQAWFITAAMVMIGFVRRGSIDSWFSKYFAEMDKLYHIGGSPYQVAAWSIAILGILGGFALGMASDRIFTGKPYKRPPIIAAGFLGMIIMLAITDIGINNNWNPFLIAALLGCLSFFVNGAHGLMGGAVSMDFGGKKAAGTAAGLFDGAQYLVAGTLIGMTLGQLLKNYGWNIWLKMLIPFASAGLVIMLVLWYLVWRKYKQEIEEKEAATKAILA